MLIIRKRIGIKIIKKVVSLILNQRMRLIEEIVMSSLPRILQASLTFHLLCCGCLLFLLHTELTIFDVIPILLLDMLRHPSIGNCLVIPIEYLWQREVLIRIRRGIMLAQFTLQGTLELSFIGLLITELAAIDVEGGCEVAPCLLNHQVLLVKRKILDFIEFII